MNSEWHSNSMLIDEANYEQHAQKSELMHVLSTELAFQKSFRLKTGRKGAPF